MGGSHRNRHDNLPGPLISHTCNGDSYGKAGSKTVINDNRRFPSWRNSLLAGIYFSVALYFFSLILHDAGKLVGIQAGPLLGVFNEHISLRDSANRIFGIIRVSDFTNHNNIKRYAKFPRNFGANNNSAAW